MTNPRFLRYPPKSLPRLLPRSFGAPPHRSVTHHTTGRVTARHRFAAAGGDPNNSGVEFETLMRHYRNVYHRGVEVETRTP